MPKMRGFKPELWTDEKFVELDPLARLLFMGMWTYACDNGHLDDKPKQIKMRVLPTDSADAGPLIEHMVDLGMVERIRGGLVIPKLRDHQRLDNRYFTWCDRCEVNEIPEPARAKYLALMEGKRREPVVDTSCAQSANAVVTREGRKEGTEGEGERKAATRKRPATRLPDDWKPTETHWEKRHDAIDVENEAQKFRLHAEANDRRQVNWNAAFSQWLLNARPGNVRPLRPDSDGQIQLPPLPSKSPWGP